jgi:dethiobiotin synthetase
VREGWVVVLGTGTEIGKTEVSASLLRGARAAGHQVVGLKPVLTGSDEPDDAVRLGAAAGLTVRPLFEFEPPISPHLAARAAGAEISLTAVGEWVTAHAREVTLVETAGGMLSPLSDRTTNLDLAVALQPASVVLVTSARLGVLHNVAAAIVAARQLAPDLRWSAIVVSSPEAGFEVAVRELRDVVLPRVECVAPVVGFGPVGGRAAKDDLALFRACIPRFT